MNKLYLIAFASAAVLVGCGQKEEALPVASSPASGSGSLNLMANASPAAAQPDATAAAPAPASLPPVQLTAADPLGGKGRELTQDEISLLNYGVYMFKEEKGRFPASLDEAVKNRYITRLPELPAGEQYQYDSQSGAVSISKK